jgi:predicted flap endonuclease-1-like 5' DNA nuclease
MLQCNMAVRPHPEALTGWKRSFSMAWFDEVSGLGVTGEQAQKAWRTPMGFASPLWFAFGAAASAGVAYWWMTRWTKTVNVEALAGLVEAPLASLVEPEPVAVVEPVADVAPEPVLAVAPEPIVVEAAPVVAAPAPEKAKPVKAVKAAPPAPDDLTRMNGIGPKLSESLAARGVTRFAHIAAWTADDLAEIDKALSLKGRAVREAWVAQAKRFAHAS